MKVVMTKKQLNEAFKVAKMLARDLVSISMAIVQELDAIDRGITDRKSKLSKKPK